MKLYYYVLFLGLISAPSAGISSTENTNPISRSQMEEITESSLPQENSPFFIEREEARQGAVEAATNPIYRSSVLLPRHSFQEEIKKCTNRFLSITKIIPDKAIPTPLQIVVEPSSFSVSDTPELSVSFKITNTKKEMLFLDFLTNQRIEIVVKEKNGTIITRWSEDRSFDPIKSVITINPKESVVYTEKISTAFMKNGISYAIEASLVSLPEYSATQWITPEDSSSG